MAIYIASDFDKAWWKSVEWCLRYSTFFYVFPVDTFSTWKIETKLWVTSIVPHIFIDFEHLGHNPEKYLQLVDQYTRKLTTSFPLHPNNMKEEAKFMEER